MSRARVLLALAFCAASLALASPAQAGQLLVGAAAVDASWHVGASAGQYASSADPTSGEFDPFTHSIKNAPSYGIQSRLQVRAIVIQEAGGRKLALVKTDMYIPQDLLWRRAAQILAARHIGIDEHNLTMTITHDHSSPYYSSTAPGVWTFQDVFDVRFFNYYAHRIADAVTAANATLRPARMGASVMTYDKPQRNALGPAVGDDGTPAGFPNSYTDHELIVVRFDEAAGAHRPIATFIDYELHGEGLSGNDLISADFVGPLQRMLDRRIGGVAYYAQNAVGTTEPERSPDYHNVHERLDFPHKEYAQNEYEASGIAHAVLHLWSDIGAGRPEPGFESRFIPFTSEGPVSEHDQWFPGPLSHPYPSVSSCRSDAAFHGDPRIPVVGLPDCESVSNGPSAAGGAIGVPFDYTIPTVDPGLTANDFKARGIPVPDNTSAPSYGALEEDLGVHLQAFRVGPISFTVCSCEQWADQSLNIKTRTDRIPGNEYLGFDWSRLCRRDGNGSYRADGTGTGTWTCPNPAIYSTDMPKVLTLPRLSDYKIEHMRAQVFNPANGWNDPAYVAQAESEPIALALIKGNYTQDDTAQNARYGAQLTVPISMANDYNGYIATYREYQRGDHYRKALTGWGPHSSDYMATRLVEMVRELNGGPALPAEPLQAKEAADNLANDQKADQLGQFEGPTAAYDNSLPDDGGRPGPASQPRDIERFSAAFFTWIGGSNYTDNPAVVVQRRVGGAWVPFADQSGELPVTLKYPQPTDTAAFLLGNQTWRWTATFEAFVSRYDLLEPWGRATPAGVYRFVVSGLHRSGHQARPYRVISREFRVSPWSGIRVQAVRRLGSALVYTVGPRRVINVPKADGYPAATADIGPIAYPETYRSPVRFIRLERSFIRDPAAPADPRRFEWYCNTCSFRPWLGSGDAQRGSVTVISAGGRRRVVRAVRAGAGWIAPGALGCGDRAYVAAGGVQDAWGDVNGLASPVLSGGPDRPDRTAPRTVLPRRDVRVGQGRIFISGVARDWGGCRAGVRRVRVFIVLAPAHHSGRCRFVTAAGQLTAPRSCAKPVLLSARGTVHWRLSVSRRGLPCGNYRIVARAVDRSGNREPPRDRGVWFVLRGCRRSPAARSVGPF